MIALSVAGNLPGKARKRSPEYRIEYSLNENRFQFQVGKNYFLLAEVKAIRQTDNTGFSRVVL
jgi:hypothetical protein